ncbi:MAG: hypothetical protein JSW58_14770 [Candidatus Latescibacterota bacterium]|nr:MAG: hypothetical protein JSW58_14770 [Candidatus Latescibacterota bacterium]
MSKETISKGEIYERLHNISMKSPEHLKRWLQESGRRYLVFESADLVDSVPWPEGVDTLIQIIACYGEYRRSKPTGRFETQTDPTLGEKIEVPIMKGELLEVDELDRAIRFLIGQITEREPGWSLENPPM